MPANHAAALSVIADHLDRYHEQVGEFVPDYQRPAGTGDDLRADVVIALVEAERSLRTAARQLRRAAKLATAAG